MSDEARNVEILKQAYKRWSDSRGGSADDWLKICADNIAFGSIAQGAAQGAHYLTAYQQPRRAEGLFRRARARLGDDRIRRRAFRGAGRPRRDARPLRLALQEDRQGGVRRRRPIPGASPTARRSSSSNITTPRRCMRRWREHRRGGHEYLRRRRDRRDRAAAGQAAARRRPRGDRHHALAGEGGGDRGARRARAWWSTCSTRRRCCGRWRRRKPEVVIHQLTDLPDTMDPAQRAVVLERNARLRIEGTRNLMAAAQAAGARRVVAQSIAFIYAPGPQPHREGDPLDEAKPSAPPSPAWSRSRQQVLDTPGIDGVVLRYGRLYGPGTWFAAAKRPGRAARPMPRRTPRCWRSRAARPASTTSPRTTAPIRSRRRGASSASIRVSGCADLVSRAHCGTK